MWERDCLTGTRHPLELLVRNLQLRASLPEADCKAILDLPYTFIASGQIVLISDEAMNRR